MKSFSQFLQESYLNEEEAVQGSLLTRKGKAQNFRSGRTPFVATDPIQQGPKSSLPDAPKSSPSSPGQLEIPQEKTTKVKSPATRVRDPWTQFPKKPQQQRGTPTEGPSSRVPNRTLSPAGGTSVRPALPAAGETAKGGALVKTSAATPAPTPEIKPVSVTDVTPKPKALPAAKPVSTATAPAAKPSVGKPPAGPKIKVPSGLAKAGRIGGKLLGPAAAALDVADERSKGSGWARSLAKGAVTAAGAALGGTAGSVAGPVGTIGGATAGSVAASKAFDTVAGANAAQRKAMATATRKAQSGGAIAGIGGKTTFDTKKGTMTTGSGSQQRTVKLGKTSVVTDPKTGKQDVGYLAYKGGKAVYKRGQSPQSLAQTSSNPLERIGRSLFAGAYQKSDAAAAAKKLAAARQSDVARQKALGVKMKPGG